MNNLSETPIKEIQNARLFTEFFIHAHAVIGQSPEAILSSFPDCVPYHRIPKKECEDTILKIPIGSLTLSCIMNKQNLCEATYTAIDPAEERDLLNRLIHYCNRTFPYHYIFKIWYTEESTIELTLYRKFASLSISKSYPLPEILRKM